MVLVLRGILICVVVVGARAAAVILAGRRAVLSAPPAGATPTTPRGEEQPHDVNDGRQQRTRRDDEREGSQRLPAAEVSPGVQPP